MEAKNIMIRLDNFLKKEESKEQRKERKKEERKEVLVFSFSH